MDRQKSTQYEKYIAFKRAHDTYKQCINEKNYIAAYVVAFSIVEDRVRAMFCISYMAEHGEEPSEKLMRSPLKSKVDLLRKKGDLTIKTALLILDEAINRNRLIHSAMWSLDNFSQEVAEWAMDVARKVDSERRKQKNLYKL